MGKMGSLLRKVNMAMGHCRMSRSFPKPGLDSQVSVPTSSAIILACGGLGGRKDRGGSIMLYIQKDPCLN